MKSVSVIGGSGFIGTRLVQRLIRSQRLNITIIDKVPSRAFPHLTTLSDVRSPDQLEKTIVAESIIVNLAAEHRDNVRPLGLYEDVNVNGAVNICTAARNKNVKTIIFTSTVAVYGFAPIGTDERGEIAPFGDYGRTKYKAEQIFKAWQAEKSAERSLVIIRPTVVFGEQNRGNVYNLLNQVVSKKFVMVGNGRNRKSMAYVENVASFIEFSMDLGPGVHIFNYIDKPDFTMNELVKKINQVLGRVNKIGIKIPFCLGFLIGAGFDFLSFVTGRQFTVSSIRVKKFCTDSVYNTAIDQTGFMPPVPLERAIELTVRYEFMEAHESDGVFYTE